MAFSGTNQLSTKTNLNQIMNREANANVKVVLGYYIRVYGAAWFSELSDTNPPDHVTGRR
jgi:hypothetical protein